MSLNLNQKKNIVRELSQLINSAKAGVLAEYRGLTVAELTSLRKDARNAGVSVKVIKNNLAKRVIAGTNFECLTEYLIGPMIFSISEDPVSVAKIISNFSMENDHCKIKVGAMNGSLIDQTTIEALSKLLDRNALLIKFIETLRGPIQKLASNLNEVPSQFVRILSKMAESNETA